MSKNNDTPLTIRGVQEKHIPDKTYSRIYQVVAYEDILKEGKDYIHSGKSILVKPSGVDKLKKYFEKHGKSHTSPNHKTKED